MTADDIIDITESTDCYNFHSHTQFCDGRVSMEVMVVAAINAGMKHWDSLLIHRFPLNRRAICWRPMSSLILMRWSA